MHEIYAWVCAAVRIAKGSPTSLLWQLVVIYSYPLLHLIFLNHRDRTTLQKIKSRETVGNGHLGDGYNKVSRKTRRDTRWPARRTSSSISDGGTCPILTPAACISSGRIQKDTCMWRRFELLMDNTMPKFDGSDFSSSPTTR